MNDIALTRLAARQHWLVTRRQLLDRGLTDRQIELRLGAGVLVPDHHNVYAWGGAPETFEQKVLAACWATGGFASHRSAARLFGLRGFDRTQTVEITVDRRRAPELEGVVVHKTRCLHPTTIGIIPVTMPAQIVVDLAGVEPGLVEGALADVLRRELVRLPALVRFLGDHSRSGRPGGPRLRALVEEHVKGREPTESWLEDRVLDLLRRYGLPEPVRQFRLGGMRLDFAYPDVRLDVEADGRLWHTSPADVRRDEERDARAAALGWAVERVTWFDVSETPEAVAARVARWVAVPGRRAA